MSWHSLFSEATQMAPASGRRGAARPVVPGAAAPRRCVTAARRRAVSVHRKNIHCTASVFRIAFLSRGYIADQGTGLKTSAG